MTYTRPPIRSVLLECQTWRDTYGNPYTSARVWINGACVGTMAYRYGHSDDVAYYELERYLERVEILAATAPGEYSPHVGRRLREIGADYYETTAYGKRRDLISHTELLDGYQLTETLARRERVSA